MQNFRDKTAVITGGANGIGLSIATALAREGAHSVIADLDQAACDRAAETIAALGVRSVGIKCDVTSAADITALADRAWDQFGQIDLLFNNAGVGAGGPAHRMDEASLRWVFEVNFFGNWACCMEFLRRFKTQGRQAHICNTASENAIGAPTPFLAGYNASKAAVLGYSNILRMELPDFISISLLCPGSTKTQIGQSASLRPEKFGGPLPPAPAGTGVAAYGYEVDTVGAHTLAEIKKGSFYIVPHYASRHLAEERCNELMAAFDAQTQHEEGWERYDTRRYFATQMQNRERDKK